MNKASILQRSAVHKRETEQKKWLMWLSKYFHIRRNRMLRSIVVYHDNFRVLIIYKRLRCDFIDWTYIDCNGMYNSFWKCSYVFSVDFLIRFRNHMPREYVDKWKFISNKSIKQYIQSREEIEGGRDVRENMILKRKS